MARKPRLAPEPAAPSGVSLIPEVPLRDAGGDFGDVLHLVICLDRSPSMQGAPIKALNEGLREFIKGMREDPAAKKSLELSVIAFPAEDRDYEVLVQATTIEAIHDIQLTCKNGGTPMGAAINAGLDLLQQRHKEYRDMGRQIFKPMMVVMTDGAPTDDTTLAAQRIMDLDLPRVEGGPKGKAAIFPLLVMEDEENALKPGNPAFQALFRRRPVRGVTIANMRPFWSWLGKSCAIVSRSIPGQDAPLATDTSWTYT